MINVWFKAIPWELFCTMILIAPKQTAQRAKSFNAAYIYFSIYLSIYLFADYFTYITLETDVLESFSELHTPHLKQDSSQNTHNKPIEKKRKRKIKRRKSNFPVAIEPEKSRASLHVCVCKRIMVERLLYLCVCSTKMDWLVLPIVSRPITSENLSFYCYFFFFLYRNKMANAKKKTLYHI